MTSRYSKQMQIFNAKQFKESVSEPLPANLYFTIGRVDPWANDSNPPQANTSLAAFNEIWRNMAGGKKIFGSDIRHVVPRIDWTANTVYNAYDNLTDSLSFSASGNFYVMTDDFNVYKCLSNNYGAVSTTKPTATPTLGFFQTLDGYIWKYMYTINDEERLNFLTPSFMPVKTLELSDGSSQWQVQNFSIDGALDVIKVTNGGSGYIANNITVTIQGDGIEANAFAIRNVTTNTISSIVVDNRGSGYTYANVTLSAANGTGASARAIIGPTGGHGSDPLSELGGSYLILNIRLRDDEDGRLLIENDYRQVSIIENPNKWKSALFFSNAVFKQTTSVSLVGISSEYLNDEYVFQGSSLSNSTFRGIVAKWDSSNNVLELTNVEGTPSSDLLIGNQSTAARFLNSATPPDLEPYTGKLLYINNIEPIERSEIQTESFKIILTF